MNATLARRASGQSHLWWLLPLTIVYLLFELAFSARLLDIAGGLSTLEELDAIEFAGKTLSGCALALFLVGSPILPMAHRREWSRWKTLVVVGIATALSISFAHAIEQAIIDSLVDRSSGVERRVAVLTSSLRGAVLEGVVELADLELTLETAETPEGKAMIALLPLMAAQASNLDERLGRYMPDILREHLQWQFGPERFHNEIYRPSLIALERAFVGFGDTMKLGFDGFLKLPPIQRQWREAMQVEFDDFEIAYAYDASEIRKQVYQPLLDRRVRAELSKLGAPPQDYADGGALEEIGRQAREGVIVPPLALAFSLIGGVTHIGKTIVYLLMAVSVPLFARLAVMTSIVAAALWLPFHWADPITASPTFASLHRQTETKLGPVGATALLWVIRLEGKVYPLNDAIRHKLMRGITFGG